MGEDILLDSLKAIAALAFVIGLMGGLALLLKKFGINGVQAMQPGDKRLGLIESIPLDARRRLVLIQRDNNQHLVILSTNGETVVETNIKAPKNDDRKT